MNHSEFCIGLEFMASAGFWWRCTDVGTRTILAVRLDREDANWYQGPPYIAEEVVFDEHELELCYMAELDAISAAVHQSETSGHPGYSAEAVNFMMAKLRDGRCNSYPRKGVLRFDRLRLDGEILHPYAGRKERNGWAVEVYLPFINTYDSIPEDEFIALPRVSAHDIRTRAGRG